MIFLTDKDRTIVEKRLVGMRAGVTLLHFTRESEFSYWRETLALLGELERLSDKLEFEVHDVAEDPEKACEEGIACVPATKIVGAEDRGIRYLGIPTGFVFPALLDDIAMVSVDDSGLSDRSRERLSALVDPLHVQVYVTPGCPHCPGAVRLSHQFAMESDLVTAETVEAKEFPELVERYGVTSVPMTVVNGRVAVSGMRPEELFLELILDTAASNGAVSARGFEEKRPGLLQ